MRRITVCTADIIDSRKQGDFARRLAERLSTLKHAAVLSPFTLSRGDEIQGVLSGWLDDPAIIRRLRYAVRPLELRIGIGWGEADPSEIAADPWDMNGQAFFRARQAVDMIKRVKYPVTAMQTGAPALDDLGNSIWSLLDAVERSWTDRQWEAVHTYEDCGTLESAAERLGIKAQNVQKHCSRADWADVRRAEETLSRLASYRIVSEPGSI